MLTPKCGARPSGDSSRRWSEIFLPRRDEGRPEAATVLIHNAEIASALDEIADVLEIEGANPFRIRAYRNAARLIGDLGREVTDMVRVGEDLTGLPGIGADLAGKIAEIAATGRSAFLEALHAQIPEA